MATVLRGHTFAADAEVTNTTLHSMVDNASVNDIGQDDVAANHGFVVTSVTEPVTSALWRDAGGEYKVKAYEPISGEWKIQADNYDIAAVSGAVGNLGKIIDNSYFVDHKNILLAFTETTVTVNGDYIFIEGYRIDLTSSLTGNIVTDLDTGVAGNKWYSVIIAVKEGGKDPKIVFTDATGRVSKSSNLPVDYVAQRYAGCVYRNENNVLDKIYDAFTDEVIGDLSGDIQMLLLKGSFGSIDISSYIPPFATSAKVYYKYTVGLAGQVFNVINIDNSVGVPGTVISANQWHSECGWATTNGETLNYQISNVGTTISFFIVAGFKQNAAKLSY